MENNLTTPGMAESTNTTTTRTNPLPAKSKELYDKTYGEFMEWCGVKNIQNITESVLLSFFSEISEKGLIASLWPKYSMLKATLKRNQNIDITHFTKLNLFLKRKTASHVSKQSKILTKEQIQTFILTAPNNIFLMTKVAVIFAVTGALRRSELVNLMLEDVHDMETKFIVSAKDTRTKASRIFAIADNETNNCELIRDYISLRPEKASHGRFFVFYKDGKCSRQPVGVNTFAKLPSRIAKFLKLEEPHLYTGHCFRRSSALILSDFGPEFAAAKKQNVIPKTTPIVESDDNLEDMDGIDDIDIIEDIEDPNDNKEAVAQTILLNQLMSNKNPEDNSANLTSTSSSNVWQNADNLKLDLNMLQTSSNLSLPSLSFNNCKNVQIHIHVTKSDT